MTKQQLALPMDLHDDPEAPFVTVEEGEALITVGKDYQPVQSTVPPWEAA
jgi:hypothetical protein